MKKKFGKILLLLVSAIVIFIALLYVESSILHPNGTGTVLLVKESIGENTVITNENIDTYVKEKENVDGELLLEEGISNKKDLVNKIANREIKKGEIISNDKFTNKDDILSTIENPIEISIKANDISQLVGGILREGDLVNVSVIDTTTKENDSVLINAYVDKTFSTDGTIIKRGDSTPAISMNLIIDSKYESKVNSALANGSVRISKIK